MPGAVSTASSASATVLILASLGLHGAWPSSLPPPDVCLPTGSSRRPISASQSEPVLPALATETRSSARPDGIAARPPRPAAFSLFPRQPAPRACPAQLRGAGLAPQSWSDLCRPCSTLGLSTCPCFPQQATARRCTPSSQVRTPRPPRPIERGGGSASLR